MKLPEMSVIDTHLPSNTKIRGFTTEQMLAWGKACAAAERGACLDAMMQSTTKAVDTAMALEREACAAICDEHADDPVYCGAAIRARGNT
jgi:hypothetical protein